MGGGSDINVSSDDVMEVATAVRNFARTLDGDRLRPADVMSDAMAAIAEQPSISGAQEVVKVHSGAQEIVTSTLAGVKQDLENFAGNLEKSVEDLEMADRTIERLLGLFLPGGANPDVEVPVGDDEMGDIGNSDGPSAGDDARDRAIDERGESA